MVEFDLKVKLILRIISYLTYICWEIDNFVIKSDIFKRLFHLYKEYSQEIIVLPVMGDTIEKVSKSSILTKVSILSILAKSIGNSIPLERAMFLVSIPDQSLNTS